MHRSTFRKFTLLFGLVALVAVAGGCKKKVAATPPAPPPAPALQPTVTLNASPSTINSGQTVTLSWSSTNATDLDIRTWHRKSRAARLNSSESDTVHNVHDHCHGRRRKRYRQCER